MGNTFFKFKQFTIHQEKTAMKVGVDGVLLGAWVDVGHAQNILDIGTGTGLLSLMLAQKSLAKITALEIEKGAFIQAKENIGLCRWGNRIEIINCSIQEYIENTSEKFELIVCNPPFFSDSLNSKNDQRNLARHDESLPLKDLLASVAKLMSEHGRFYMIYPFDRREELIKAGENYQLYPNSLLNIKGTVLKEPNRLIAEFVAKKSSCVEHELVVRDIETNDYTYEYKQLTKDYYLKF